MLHPLFEAEAAIGQKGYSITQSTRCVFGFSSFFLFSTVALALERPLRL